MSRLERLTVLRTAAEHFRGEAQRWADRGDLALAMLFAEKAVSYERTARAVERSAVSS